MKIRYESDSGIKGLRNLGIEGILSILFYLVGASGFQAINFSLLGEKYIVDL